MQGDATADHKSRTVRTRTYIIGNLDIPQTNSSASNRHDGTGSIRPNDKLMDNRSHPSDGLDDSNESIELSVNSVRVHMIALVSLQFVQSLIQSVVWHSVIDPTVIA